MALVDLAIAHLLAFSQRFLLGYGDKNVPTGRLPATVVDG